MKNRIIKLLVFDLDGTALGGHTPYDQFPRPFAKFLDELHRSGIHWATNTTWPPDAQFNVIARSGVKSKPAFLTGQTGRSIATVENNRLVPDVKYEKMVLSRDKRFKRRHWPAIRGIFLSLLEKDSVDRISFNFNNHNMIEFSCKKGKRKIVWDLLGPLVDSGEFYLWNPVRGKSNTLLPKYMNKGEIVNVLRKRLGIGAENIIVAGDATNDLHMFDPKIAKHMVCPSNACDQVKHIVRSHGGVVAVKEYSWGVIEGVTRILKSVNGQKCLERLKNE